MSECAVLSANGEVRYHEKSNNSASSGEAQPAFSSSAHTSASSNMTELETEKGESSVSSAPVSAPLPNSVSVTSSAGQQNKTPDDYSAGLEVPLRRSKRGKGRGTSNASSQNNNGVSSDDRVSSCVVEGVEYKTGDFVYYEEPDFEYYTIGLIEEIKFSRRDKFAVLVKCFYRTHDIPEASKQSVFERENFHTPSNSKLMNDVLSRELFASEVQETLTSKQLRGRCRVSHLTDLHTAMTAFCPTEEDNFFYVFAYNPETRRLMNTRAEIRVGNAYQATIPPFRHCPPATYRTRPHRCIDCPKHNRSTECNPTHSTDPVLSSSNSGAVCTHTLDRSISNDVLEAVSDQPPAPEDLLSAISHNLAEEDNVIKPHSSRVSSNTFKKDESYLIATEGEEPKSPPKLESFRSGSPKHSTTPPPTASDSASHLDSGRRQLFHRHHSRRRIIPSRHDGCSRLANPLRRRIKRGHSVHRRIAGHRHRRRRFETIVWRPQGLSKALSGHSPDPMITRVTQSDEQLADEPLKTYLDAVRSMVAFFGFGGADDDVSSAENGLVLANLATTTQHAYDTLHKSDYSLTQALQTISCNPIVSKSTPRHWTADQVRLFAHALRLHGKDFHTIQREFFGGRNLNTSATSGSAGPNGTVSSTGQTASGRTRGRGGGRRKVIGGSIKSTVKEDDEVKPEDGKDEASTSVDDPARNATARNELVTVSVTPEPVKTVKELISFYYYWKRKGAAASVSSSSGVLGAGGTNIGVGAGGSLAHIGGGGLASAAVNFSAAVAAAAGADNVTVTSTSAAHNSATGSQSYGSGGKKRKQTTRGNLSARASTPNSERSESAGASLPESEIEDAADLAAAAGTAEEAQPMDCHADQDEDAVGSTKPDTDGLDAPSSSVGRLRRRLCRNCEKDLSSPGEAALPAGVGQLRFLCLGCRVHLQKYGELKITARAQTTDETQSKSVLVDAPNQDINKVRHHHHRHKRHRSREDVLVDSNATLTQQTVTDDRGMSSVVKVHSSPHWQHVPTSTSSAPAQPFLSPSSWSPCSYMDDEPKARSNSSSPHSWRSWRSYSSCSWSGSVTPSVSDSSLSVTSISSGCICSGSGSGSEWSTDTESAVPGASPHRRRRPSGLGDQSKRRRYQNRMELDGHGLIKTVVPPATPVDMPNTDNARNGLPRVFDRLSKREPLMRDCASVPVVVRPREETVLDPAVSRQPPRPGSTPVCKPKPPTEPSVNSIINADVVPQIRGPVRSVTTTVTAKVSATEPNDRSHHSDLFDESVDGMDAEDPEVIALLSAPLRDPIPCFVEVHQSLWSNLTRIWDRSMEIFLPNSVEHRERILRDPGTCSRTDLVYAGRRLAVEDKARWLWARGQLYAKHADTAIGPGSVELTRSSDPLMSPTTTPGTDRLAPNQPQENDSRITGFGVENVSRSTPSTQTGVGSDASNNVALDLCARLTPSHSPATNRSTSSHLVQNLSYSSNRARRGSANSLHPPGPNSRHTPSHSPSPRAVPFQQPVNTFDPSHTHHHIQAAYEQAMLLAVANSHHHNHHHQSQSQQSYTPGQSPSITSRDVSKAPSASCLSSRSGLTVASATKAVVHTMPSRLGAAAGTFYPPALITSSSATGSAPLGLTSASPTDRTGQSQLTGSANATSMAYQQHLSHSPASGLSHPSFVQPSYPLTSVPSADAKNPEALQRQLVMMGFLPPEQALLNALDPREAEALRRFMAEKLGQFRGQVPANHVNTSHDTLLQQQQQTQHFLQQQQQQQQQQELLAAAAVAELVMRRGEHFPISSHNNINPGGFPQMPNCGAMTSAVNTTTTRPTASVQLPQSFRYPTATQTPPLASHAIAARGLQHSTPEGPLHAPQPPTAHHNPGSRLSVSTGATSVQVSAANYFSMLTGGTGTVSPRTQLPIPASPGLSRPNGTTTSGSSTGPAGGNPCSIPGPTGIINGAAAMNAQFQEQVMHAAKFAMLAANMQGDPNKAAQFANLAAAAFAELAAAHDNKSPSQAPASFGSHGLSPMRTQPQPTGPNPAVTAGAFDLRSHHAAALLQSHLSDSSNPSHNPNMSNFLPHPPPLSLPQCSPHTGDRRRSVPSSATQLSCSSAPISSPSGLLLPPNPVPSSAGAGQRLTQWSSLNPPPSSGHANRFNTPPTLPPASALAPPPNVPSPSQLAQFAQLAQQSAAAGFAQGLSLQDPVMLNALMLAAAAAHAANPGAIEPNNPFLNDLLERQRFQQASMGSRNLTLPHTHQQQLQSQQPQSQQTAAAAAAAVAAAAAAAAAFAGAGLPPLNLGTRLPSSHS